MRFARSGASQKTTVARNTTRSPLTWLDVVGGPASHLDATFVRGRPRARSIGTDPMRRLLLKLIRRRRLHEDLEAELAFHREMSSAHGNPISLGNRLANHRGVAGSLGGSRGSRTSGAT